jgi:hypothetical protein
MVYITREIYLDPGGSIEKKTLQNECRDVHGFYSLQKEAIQFAAEQYKFHTIIGTV